MANLKIVIDALNNASEEIGTVKEDIEGIGSSAEEATPSTDTFFDKLVTGLGSAGLVAGVLATVKQGFDKLVDIAEPAAELDAAKTKFDNLTTSIGGVSDALLIDLRTATSGMATDADLVRGAAKIIASGIADTQTEVSNFIGLADDLGISVSSLVDVLTSQTTTKFDEIGLSTIGFKDRVDKLTEAGLSAEEAFGQAFLEYARTAIENSGSAADTAQGSFDRYRAAVDNLKMAFSEGLLPVLTPVLEALTGIMNWFNNPPSSSFPDFVRDLTSAFQDGILTEEEYYALQGDVYNGLMTEGEAMDVVAQKSAALRQANVDLSDSQEDVIYSLIDATSNFSQFKQAAEEAGVYIGILDEETYNAEKALRDAGTAGQDASDGITAAGDAADGAAGGMTAVADATNNADMAMRRYSESLLFKIASEGLSEEAAYDLAVAMGLVDQNTVAATEQTNIYKQMLDSGAITQSQYNLLIEDLADNIENLPEGHTLEVEDNVDDVKAHLSDLETWKVEPIPVTLSVDDSSVQGYRPPTKTGTVVYREVTQGAYAVGGAVTGGNPYNWQEYGYRGEVFVPSADGFVLSRADAERALARALYGGGSAISPEEIGKAVAQALSGITSSKKGGNVYNLTMPTSSNPADIRTAFELMEAWA
ncbi:MAG TPA: hypothetical protein PLY04_18140 [bacterium]|nr:hypothetical protein [bacterium]